MPGGKFKTITVFGLIILAFGLAAWSQAADEESLYKQAQTAHKKFHQNKKAQEYRHEWLRLIQRYEKLIHNYPSGKRTASALMTVGDLYLGLYGRSRSKSDADSALDAYRLLTGRFPRTTAAAHAQLRIGQIYHHIKHDPDRAYVELLKVELNHPQGRSQVSEARKLMARISGNAGQEPPKPAGTSMPETLTPPAVVPAGPIPPAGLPAAPVRPSPPAIKKIEPASNQALVQRVRHWHNPTYSRVAVDLSQPVSFQDHLLLQDPALGKPMRLYLDFKKARIGPSIPEDVLFADGLLKRARVAQYDQDTVRLVLDIQHINTYRIFSLDNPFRIVVDVVGTQGQQAPPVHTARVDPQTTVSPSPPSHTPPTGPKQRSPLTDLRNTAKKRKKVPRGPAKGNLNQSSLARQLGLGVNRVIIDPGHGGKDNGATGVTGLKEKDLVLRVARNLAGKLRKRLGLEVIVTRSKDIFIPLEERTARANTEVADLFISIHANAHKNPKIQGIETYFLNLATDEEAMRVAARENAATKKTMGDLQMILSDLMLNSKITESGRLSVKVHKAMLVSIRKKYRGIRDLGVKQAPFYVLIGANMPSILIELGFLSNKREEKLLKSNSYINQLTDGIVEGIRQYNTSIKKSG